jgi:hypothetical protein
MSRRSRSIGNRVRGRLFGGIVKRCGSPGPEIRVLRRAAFCPGPSPTLPGVPRRPTDAAKGAIYHKIIQPDLLGRIHREIGLTEI